MKLTLGILTLAMSWVVISPLFASMPQGTSAPPEQQATPKAPAESSADAVEYKNAKYSFTFSLPQGWKGYTIVTDKWEASDAQKGVVENGPIVCIRHPDWTRENPRQDIPIVVFTLAQWASAEKSNLYVGGSAIGFHELGRNRKYAFAVSTRYNEADVAGREEVDKILQHEPLHPLWSK
jgi:predicted carbohydrate-binding protein with CBM5 and CBM33 domain